MMRDIPEVQGRSSPDRESDAAQPCGPHPDGTARSAIGHSMPLDLQNPTGSSSFWSHGIEGMMTSQTINRRHRSWPREVRFRR